MKLLGTFALLLTFGPMSGWADLLTTAEVDGYGGSPLCSSVGTTSAQASCSIAVIAPPASGTSRATASYGDVSTFDLAGQLGDAKSFALATDSITIEGQGTGFILFEVSTTLAPVDHQFSASGSPGPMPSMFSAGQSATSFPFAVGSQIPGGYDVSDTVSESVTTPFTFGVPLDFSLSTSGNYVVPGEIGNSAPINTDASIGQILLFSDPNLATQISGFSYYTGSGATYDVAGGSQVPEPKTLPLAGLSLTVCAVIARRRFQHLVAD